MDNNKKYEAACEKANAAYQVFDAIRVAYRAGKVDDDTFLAARAVHEAAKAEYDEAFTAASEIETSDKES